MEAIEVDAQPETVTDARTEVANNSPPSASILPILCSFSRDVQKQTSKIEYGYKSPFNVLNRSWVSGIGIQGSGNNKLLMYNLNGAPRQVTSCDSTDLYIAAQVRCGCGLIHPT